MQVTHNLNCQGSVVIIVDGVLVSTTAINPFSSQVISVSHPTMHSKKHAVKAILVRMGETTPQEEDEQIGFCPEG